MAKSPGRPTGGKRNKDPGGRTATNFTDDKLQEFFEDDEEGSKSGTNQSHQSVTNGQSCTEGIKNRDDDDAVMADTTTNDDDKPKADDETKRNSEASWGDNMTAVNDTTDEDRRTSAGQGTNDMEVEEDGTALDATPKKAKAKATNQKIRLVRFEKLVKAGEQFSPVRTMRHLLERIWEADDKAFVDGGDGRAKLTRGTTIPKHKKEFEKYFVMAKVDDNGGLHVGFLFYLVSAKHTEALKKADELRKFLQDESAWFNDQPGDFESPLTRMIGWIAMVPPTLAAHDPFGEMLKEAWTTHDEFERIIGYQIPLGVFPGLSLRVAKVYADPTKRGPGDVWTFMVEVRCEREYAHGLTRLATTGNYPGHPIGLFVPKDAANDVDFMSKIIIKHNKFNCSLVVIPLEGFCPSILDAAAITVPGGYDTTVLEFLIGSETEVDVNDQVVEMKMFTGVFARNDSDTTGIIYLTTTKLAAKKASDMIDLHIIPALKGLPCYQNDGLDIKYGPHGIRRKATKVLVARDKAEDSRREYMEKTLEVIGPTDGNEGQQYNAYKQRAKRNTVPVEIVWTDEAPPVGRGRRRSTAQHQGTGYKDAAVSNPSSRQRDNGGENTNETDRPTRDDATSVGDGSNDGSGDGSAMTLATLYTTIDEQTAVIACREEEIRVLQIQAANHRNSAAEHAKILRQQKDFYEHQIERVMAQYNRKMEIAEGNAALRERTLETRLEEKWEKKLQNTVEDMMKQFAGMHSDGDKFVTVNSSPSDSSSLTTRTVSHSSPATVVATTQNDPNPPMDQIKERENSSVGPADQTKGDSTAASTNTSGSTMRVTIALDATTEKQVTHQGHSGKNDPNTAKRQSVGDETTHSTQSGMSRPIFNPYAKENKKGNKTATQSVDSSNSGDSARSKPNDNGKAPMTSSLARASAMVSKMAATSVAALSLVPNPMMPTLTTAQANSALTEDTTARLSSGDKPAPDDQMDCDEQESKSKRTKEISPAKTTSPASHHTHKKIRGRDGSPVRKSAQTDKDRGCQPTQMEVDSTDAATNQQSDGLSDIEGVNQERRRAGLTTLEVLTPSKKKAPPKACEDPTPIRHNKSPPQPMSPSATDNTAITELSSPPSTRQKLTPLKAKNLTAQMEAKAVDGWEDSDWLGEVGSTTPRKEQPKKTDDKSARNEPVQPKEAGPATKRAGPRGP